MMRDALRSVSIKICVIDIYMSPVGLGKWFDQKIWPENTLSERRLFCLGVNMNLTF